MEGEPVEEPESPPPRMSDGRKFLIALVVPEGRASELSASVLSQ